MIRVEVTGVDSAKRQIGKYADGVSAKVLKAINITAVDVHREAVQNVAVDTGRLKTSIRMDAATNKHEATVSTDVVYAPRIEFGFWNMKDKLGRLFFQRAQPFMQPAAEANKRKHSERIREALKP